VKLLLARMVPVVVLTILHPKAMLPAVALALMLAWPPRPNDVAVVAHAVFRRWLLVIPAAEVVMAGIGLCVLAFFLELTIGLVLGRFRRLAPALMVRLLRMLLAAVVLAVAGVARGSPARVSGRVESHVLGQPLERGSRCST
jgi:hypothetical protein